MKYVDHLIEQFIKANGITKYDLNSREFLREFSNWVEEKQVQNKNFVYLLLQMGIDISGINTAEVGKTSFDSIGKNYYTTMITPYLFGFEQRNNLIESGFAIDEKGNPLFNFDKPIIIDQYMTFNPYDEHSLVGWDRLHNTDKNIIVGIFGKESDKDLIKKISFLEQFKYLLEKDYIQEETKMNGTYCKVIASKNR